MIREASRRYKVIDSIFAANNNLVGSGSGQALNFKTLDPATMDLPKSIPVVDAPIGVEMDETKRTFLHVPGGGLGSDLDAGLFTKKTLEQASDRSVIASVLPRDPPGPAAEPRCPQG